MLDLKMSHGKIFGFYSFPLFGFNFVKKLKNLNFESHWNTLIFFDKKDVVSDLNISYGKMSDFLSFPLLGFTLVRKLRNFDFESHWKINIFDKKRCCVRFEYVPLKNVWFCFISIVWVYFSHKTEKFQFWRSLKYFNIFW